MNKPLKWFLVVSGTLTGLFLLLALALYLFVDINHYKKDIEQLVKAERGLDLNLSGNLTLSILSGVKFTAQNVTLLSQKKIIADVASVDLELALGSLFSDQPVINFISLNARKLKIKRNKQGNFNFLPAKVSSVTTQDSLKVDTLDINPGREDHYQLNDLAVTFSDQQGLLWDQNLAFKGEVDLIKAFI